MSWNWNENEEVKTYEQSGTVTISTEEYRDLIRRTFELKVAGQKEHDDWYAEYKKNQELEKKVTALQTSINFYNAFVNSTEQRKGDYTLYLREIKLQKLEEEND